jgi:hypothetical protein
MDLKAASDQNSTLDRLTRAGMALCFLATGVLLIGSLAFDTFHDGSGLDFRLPTLLSSR